MRTLELVVFDMAGTTVEDAGQVPEAFTTVLRRNGVAVGEAELSAIRGASKRDAIRHLLGAAGSPADLDKRTEEVFAEFRTHLSDLFRAGGVRPIAGAAQTIRWLRAKGIKVALNTGFDRTIVDLVIQALGWDAMADTLVCGDDVAQGRPAPDLIVESMRRTGVTHAGHVMAVGDTILDLRAGRRAGAGWVVGVLSGAHDRARLESEPHDHLIASVAELPGLVEVNLRTT